MKKHPIAFIIIPFFFACNAGQKKTGSEEMRGDTTDVMTEEEWPVMATTAMAVMPFTRLPEPFYMDTLARFDTMEFQTAINEPYSHTCYGAVETSFPQSTDKKHEGFNKAMKKFASDFLSSYANEDTVFYNGMNATLWVSDFEIDHDLVSVVFTDQSYFEGSAHYNHGYSSFHYDLKKNKVITLTDSLLFEDEDEKMIWCDAFNPDISMGEPEVYMEPEDFTADRPFMVDWGEITLYFSDYEKGPSMTKIHIPFCNLRSFVNPDYKAIFED